MRSSFFSGRASSSGLLSSMRTTSAMISVRYCIAPVFLSCHDRVSMRPSTYTKRPLRARRATCAASWRHDTIVCHSVASRVSPDPSFHVRLVASENCVTSLPSGVKRISGSRPTRPINCTLFRFIRTVPWSKSGPACANRPGRSIGGVGGE